MEMSRHIRKSVVLSAAGKFDMKKNTIAIAKGIDGYLEMTPLAAYCHERGLKVLQEYVIIEKPRGSALKRFNKDVKENKIVVIRKGR